MEQKILEKNRIHELKSKDYFFFKVFKRRRSSVVIVLCLGQDGKESSSYSPKRFQPFCWSSSEVVLSFTKLFYLDVAPIENRTHSRGFSRPAF